MTKDELKELIAALQAQLERLERRKPKENERVAVLYPDGQIIMASYTPSRGYDVACLSRGQILPTREEAELYDRKRIAVKAIKDYVAENMPFTPDWNDDGKEKYFPSYSYRKQQWRLVWDTCVRSNFLLPYFGSVDDGKQLIRDCKEHLDVLLEEL